MQPNCPVGSCPAGFIHEDTRRFRAPAHSHALLLAALTHMGLCLPADIPVALGAGHADNLLRGYPSREEFGRSCRQ